jgi:hypothetical protein
MLSPLEVLLLAQQIDNAGFLVYEESLLYPVDTDVDAQAQVDAEAQFNGQWGSFLIADGQVTLGEQAFNRYKLMPQFGDIALIMRCAAEVLNWQTLLDDDIEEARKLTRAGQESGNLQQ